MAVSQRRALTTQDDNWDDLALPANLFVGEAVRVRVKFLAEDGPVQVKMIQGLQGRVQSLDADGSALIEFPELRGLSRRYIASKDFDKFQVLHNEQNGK
mmetsp:Transcript_83804/g.144854  ORF Transcript_83804/g.144854 Transcript_83804/m.144854 type:complete len:99 (+) Transcript_83804:2-298(+)